MSEAGGQIFSLARRIAHEQPVRRRVMTGLLIASLGLLAFGAFIAWDFFAARPVVFVIYWFACGWLVITAAMLALYDMLQVVRAGRIAREIEKRRILGKFDDV